MKPADDIGPLIAEIDRPQQEDQRQRQDDLAKGVCLLEQAWKLLVRGADVDEAKRILAEKAGYKPTGAKRDELDDLIRAHFKIEAGWVRLPGSVPTKRQEFGGPRITRREIAERVRASLPYSVPPGTNLDDDPELEEKPVKIKSAALAKRIERVRAQMIKNGELPKDFAAKDYVREQTAAGLMFPRRARR
jgi:hypothetical protein